MIVLDTTLLVYAVGAEHELREPCRRLIDAIADGRIRATTTVEVIQELAHVRARRRGRRDAAAVAGDYAELLSPLIEVSRTDLDRGLRTFAAVDGLGAFDAVLAAAAVGAHATALVSADRAFAAASAPAHLFPDAAGVDRLLGSA